jgi:protein-tyrosine-phosphatase
MASAERRGQVCHRRGCRCDQCKCTENDYERARRRQVARSVGVGTLRAIGDSAGDGDRRPRYDELSAAGGAAVAWSGGSEPKGEINPAVIDAMAERGIDLADEYPKPWSNEILQAADVIITMGCGDAPPTMPGRWYEEEWDLDDPDSKDVAAVRAIRDEIEGCVRRLVAELAIPGHI